MKKEREEVENIRIWSWGIRALTRQNKIVCFSFYTRMSFYLLWGDNLVFFNLFGFLLQIFWLLPFSLYFPQGKFTIGIGKKKFKKLPTSPLAFHHIFSIMLCHLYPSMILCNISQIYVVHSWIIQIFITIVLSHILIKLV